jgi:RES domain-containing protein
MLSVWRIGSTKGLTLATLAFGSTLESGRWHRTPPDGQPVVYAGSSRALCQLEKRVHCNGVQPRSQALIRLDLHDDASLLDVRLLEDLPPNWRDEEPWTQDAGIRWRMSGASLGLWVPSAVEPGESNLMLNPDHPTFASIRVTVERSPFRFDDRMFDS